MKKIYLMICMAALLLVAAGCTQNNGRIGHWFGQWKVERVVVDGVDDPDYEGNAFFCFQSKVFGVRVSHPEEFSGSMCYGRWEERDDNVLYVQFNTAESSVPSSSLHLYLQEENFFRIVSADGKRKVLETTLPDGRTCTYYLRSW